jgi:hypothetical protein
MAVSLHIRTLYTKRGGLLDDQAGPVHEWRGNLDFEIPFMYLLYIYVQSHCIYAWHQKQIQLHNSPSSTLIQSQAYVASVPELVFSIVRNAIH